MPAASNQKTLAAMALVLAAIAGTAPVMAQDADWGWSDTPRLRPRPSVRVAPWYDQPYYEDERYLRRYRAPSGDVRPWRARRYDPVPPIFRDYEDDPDFAPSRPTPIG